MEPVREAATARPPERSPAWADGGVVRFGDCELHLPTREFLRQRVAQPVRKRVFDLMVFLIERRPAAATHAELAAAVWGRSDVRHTVIAQAVLEARRLTGDDLDQPVHFVTVRGHGYRFVATVRPGVQSTALTAPTGDLEAAREAVRQAREAVDRQDSEAAMRFGDRAIELAEAASANVLKARALSAAAWAALHRGSRPLAARHAYLALRLAEVEDHRAALADARVRVAQVLGTCGNFYGALQMLEAVRVPRDIAEDDPVARVWAGTGFFICANLQRFDEATAWHARAVAMSLKNRPERRAIAERIAGVYLALRRADAAVAAGQPAHAHEHFRHALDLSEGLRIDMAEVGTEEQRLYWTGNHGLALAGLGRLDEAWSLAEEVRRLLLAHPKQGSPWHVRQMSELSVQWAGLYLAMGRHAEALEQIEPALASAEAAGHQEEAFRLAMLATRASEAGRQFEAALAWHRRAEAAQQALRLDQSALLALAHDARREHESLDQALQATRAELTAAQAQLQALAEQLRARRRGAAAGAYGLLPMDVFVQALRHRHDEAVTRDLPCLVGLVVLAPRQDSLCRDTGASREWLFGAVSAEIRLQLGAATVMVCLWSDAALAFTIDGIGARRGGALCRALQDRLAESHVGGGASPGTWVFRAELFDLCAHGSFDAALEVLRRMHPPGTTGAVTLA